MTRARADVLAGPGVLTASYPNCAITDAHTSGVITQPPTSGAVASVTVAPPYKSLELLDFYYGCTLHQAAGPAANGAPVDCTVTVTAIHQISFAPVVAATFEFRPPEGLLTLIPVDTFRRYHSIFQNGGRTCHMIPWANFGYNTRLNPGFFWVIEPNRAISTI